LAAYGVFPIVCLKAWADLKDSLSTVDRRKAKVDHLFWTLHWLKKYPEEEELAGKYNKTEKTIRKWLWITVERLARLEDTKASAA
jgi:hypothetical protein